MAKNIHRLADRKVRSVIKPTNDGGNLWIYPKGNARRWIFRYYRNGRAREMGLGGYPHVSLSEAREEAAKFRKILKNGGDPIAERTRIQDEKDKVIPNFTQAAAQYIRGHRHGWKNKKHRHQWVSTLRTYAKPVIGLKPVTDITTDDLLAILSPIWATKTETATRVRCRIEAVIDWATIMKYRSGENPARWKASLDKLLPSPSRVKEEKHHPAMPYKIVPAFWKELSTRKGLSARALEFAILTGCRTNEVLGARWDEIDREEDAWNIPGSRMKMRKSHRVPLVAPMVELLNKLPKINDYLFPGQKYDKPLSNMAMLVLMRKMDYGHFVPHGFRSSFRDWVGDATLWDGSLGEAALAHRLGNKTQTAYQRGDMFEKRRALMTDWADFICNGVGQRTVIPLRGRA